MNNTTFEFNKQLELDVLLNGLTEITADYDNRLIKRFELDDVIIPEGITSIGYSAFSFCSYLRRVTIPDSVTYIGDYAFYECRGLTNLVIPASVNRIKYSAFAGCKNLTDLRFKGKTFEEVGMMTDYPWSIFPGNINAHFIPHLL